MADCILYNCYRASCYLKGRVPLNISPEQRIIALKTQKSPILREWVVPAYWIDGIGGNDCLEYLKSKHMFQAYKEGLFRPLYDPAERRFIFPIRDNKDMIFGASGSTLGNAMPKALNYNRTYTQPFICGVNRNQLMLVEDCASAVAATRAPDVAGMALLGTNIRQDFIPYMSPYTRVNIALDPDAYAKSIQLKRQLTPYVKEVRILKLPNDIKDMSDEEYNRFIGSL